MTWHILSEPDFWKVFIPKLEGINADFVTGPGRSGAVASVYASHHLGIPYKPHKCGNYTEGETALVVDTVKYTGKTLRKCQKWYAKRGLKVVTVYGLDEEQGHYYKLWYERMN